MSLIQSVIHRYVGRERTYSNFHAHANGDGLERDGQRCSPTFYFIAAFVQASVRGISPNTVLIIWNKTDVDTSVIPLPMRTLWRLMMGRPS